jgi:capsular exopolysaccharide synthesis family protein
MDVSRNIVPLHRDPVDTAWTFATVRDALRRRSLLALGTFLAVVAIGFALTAALPTRFTATALVVVDGAEARLLDLGVQGAVDVSASPNSIETQSEIARSPSVLTAAIDRLRLDQDEEFHWRPSLSNRLLGVVGLSPVPVSIAAGDEASAAMARTAVVENLERRVNVRRRGLTNVIAVSVQSRDPVKAATIANAIATTYIDQQADQKSAAARNAVAVLRGRAGALEARIRQIEGDISSFVTSAAENYGSPADVAAIRQLTDTIDRAQLDQSRTIAELTDLSSILRSDGSGAMPATTAALGSDISELMERRAALAAEAGSGTARLDRVRAELDALDSELREAVRARVTTLEDEVKAADGRVAGLRADLEQKLGAISLPNTAAVQFYTFQREAKASRDLYEATVDRLRELEQQAEFAAADARLVSEALVPNRISFPPVMLLLAATIGIGVVAGGFAAVLRDRYVGGFSSARQMAEITGQEVLATIPLHRPRSSVLADSLLSEPLSLFAEAFRRLKLGVETTLDHRRNIVVMVTSTMPGEGKSTVALGLAEIFAQSGRKTLLIDADLRRPSIGRILGFEPKRGLYDFLVGTSTLREALTTDVRYDREELNLLLGREQQGVPTDRMLESERFGNLLRSAATSFDVVVVDTPPIGDVVDARIIARHTDLCLYVVQWGQANQMNVLEGLRELARGAPARTATVLNQSADGASMSAVYYQS